MSRPYELWNLKTGNLVSVHRTEHEALTRVRASLDAHGPAYVEALALARADLKTDDLIPIAEGAELVARAREVPPAPHRGPPADFVSRRESPRRATGAPEATPADRSLA
jgi:hypothetical protein